MTSEISHLNSSNTSIQSDNNDAVVSSNNFSDPNESEVSSDPCLVCLSSVGTVPISSQNVRLGSETGEQCLSAQLNSIFVLRKLLKLSQRKCEQLLEKTGVNPEEWLRAICLRCLEIVKEALTIHGKILKLTEELERMGYKLQEMFHQSIFQEEITSTPNAGKEVEKIRHHQILRKMLREELSTEIFHDEERRSVAVKQEPFSHSLQSSSVSFSINGATSNFEEGCQLLKVESVEAASNIVVKTESITCDNGETENKSIVKEESNTSDTPDEILEDTKGPLDFISIPDSCWEDYVEEESNGITVKYELPRDYTMDVVNLSDQSEDSSTSEDEDDLESTPIVESVVIVKREFVEGKDCEVITLSSDSDSNFSDDENAENDSRGHSPPQPKKCQRTKSQEEDNSRRRICNDKELLSCDKANCSYITSDPESLRRHKKCWHVVTNIFEDVGRRAVRCKLCGEVLSRCRMLKHAKQEHGPKSKKLKRKRRHSSPIEVIPPPETSSQKKKKRKRKSKSAKAAEKDKESESKGFYDDLIPGASAMFKCPFCIHVAVSKSVFVVHLKTFHADQYKFECKRCDFAFFKREILEKTHEEDAFSSKKAEREKGG